MEILSDFDKHEKPSQLESSRTFVMTEEESENVCTLTLICTLLDFNLYLPNGYIYIFVVSGNLMNERGAPNCFEKSDSLTLLWLLEVPHTGLHIINTLLPIITGYILIRHTSNIVSMTHQSLTSQNVLLTFNFNSATPLM